MINKIKNVGGAQIYWYKKSEWLKSKGYNVVFFHYTSETDEVLIEGMKQYTKYHDDRLEHAAYLYPRRIRESVLNKMLSEIDKDYDDFIIESSTFVCSTWGELLAERLKGKHIAFYLMEELELPNDSFFDYIDFKYNRREVAGINDKVLKILYAKHGIQIKTEDSYKLDAYQGNPLCDIPYPRICEIPKSNYTIGMLTRLGKGYVEEALSSIKTFAREYADKTFTILIIGDSQSVETRQHIEHYFDELKNVKVFITGFLVPIPSSLIDLADLFINTAGAAYLTMAKKKMTITYDAMDLKPIGILGLTTNSHTLRGENESPQDLQQIMKDILIEKKYTAEMLDEKCQLPHHDVDYTDHIDFIKQSTDDRVYYNVTSINCSKKEQVKRIVFMLFGFCIGSKIFSYTKKMRGVS